MGLIAGFKGLVEIPTVFLCARLFSGRRHAMVVGVVGAVVTFVGTCAGGADAGVAAAAGAAAAAD